MMNCPFCTNESKSASVGISVGTGGFGISVAMSKANGDGNSDLATQNNSHVNAANGVTIISGGDTNIIGSNVKGKQVNADVGGNLNITSVQDTLSSAAHQSSSGGGFSVSQGGASANFSQSKGYATGSYAGVNEQARIHAGVCLSQTILILLVVRGKSLSMACTKACSPRVVQKMIIRLLRALGLFVLICIPGMGVIYIVGAYLSCAFVDGCYSKLGLVGIFESVSINGILVRGGILAAVFTLIVWPRIRQP